MANQFNPSLLNLYLQNRFIRVNLLFSLLANISLWLLLAWQTQNLSGLIALHYNIYFGIDWLGLWYQVFLLPVLGLIFFLINFFVGLAVYRKEVILSYFLAGASSSVQIIIILASIFIIFINQ